MSFDNQENWPFGVLGIEEAEATRRTIKSAYARKLKQIDQEKDPGDFQNLRQAMEMAIEIVANRDLEFEAETDARGHADPLKGFDDVQADETQTDAADRMPETRTKPIPAEMVPDEEGQDQRPAFSASFDEAIESLAGEPEKLQEIRAVFFGLERNAEAIVVIMATLDDPELFDHQANAVLGQEIANFLADCLVWSDDAPPRFPEFVTREFLQKLDLRYHWCSDFRALEDYSYQSDELSLAMRLRLEGDAVLLEQDANPSGDLSPIDKLLGALVLVSVPLYMFSRATEPGTTLDNILSSSSNAAVALIFGVLAIKIGWRVFTVISEKFRGPRSR